MIARTLQSWKLLGPVALLLAFQGCKMVSYGIELTGLSLAPATDSVAVGTTKAFTATGRFNDESQRDVTAEAAWGSSDGTVATVDAGGVATPLKAGTTTITATLSGKSASSTLTVTNALLQTVEVTCPTCPSPASPSMPNGTSIRLAATGHFDDNSTQDLTGQAAWTSTDASVNVGDTAGTKGLVTSTALGSTTSTVTATVQAIPGSATVTVNAVTLSSIAVAPATATVKVGRAQLFTATGTFSDTSTHDMTREVSWQSSDTGVATIDGTGRAVGVFASATPVTITATSSALLGSVPGTAQLTVQAAGPGY